MNARSYDGSLLIVRQVSCIVNQQNFDGFGKQLFEPLNAFDRENWILTPPD